MRPHPSTASLHRRYDTSKDPNQRQDGLISVRVWLVGGRLGRSRGQQDAEDHGQDRQGHHAHALHEDAPGRHRGREVSGACRRSYRRDATLYRAGSLMIVPGQSQDERRGPDRRVEVPPIGVHWRSPERHPAAVRGCARRPSIYSIGCVAAGVQRHNVEVYGNTEVSRVLVCAPLCAWVAPRLPAPPRPRPRPESRTFCAHKIGDICNTSCMDK